MIVSTEGIVVRTFNYRESSKVVEVFTESDGLVSLLSKGVRKTQKIAGILEPLNIIFLSFYKKANRELFLLSKFETISSCYRIIERFENLVNGLMMLVAIHQSQQQLVPNKPLYSMLRKCIESLKSKEFPPFTIFVVFILYLVEDLGISFLANKSTDILNQFNNYVILNLTDGRILEKLEGDNSIRMRKVILQKIHKLSNSNWDELSTICFDAEEQKELVSFFETYLSLHLDKEIKFTSFTLLNL